MHIEIPGEENEDNESEEEIDVDNLPENEPAVEDLDAGVSDIEEDDLIDPEEEDDLIDPDEEDDEF